MKNPSIQYYNVFAEENSRYHLSPEELYLYGLISTMKNKQQVTITNIDVIHQYSPINFFSREKESKQRIKQHLLSLKEKEVIHFENETIDNKSLLIIYFMNDLKDDSIGKGVKGFENVDFVKFNSFSTMIDHYIYFTVKRFDKLGGFTCDYKRWANILGCTERTARKKIKEAVNKSIIYKNIGDYKDEKLNNRDQKKQDKNTYKTIPFSSEEKTFQTKKVEIVQANKKRANKIKNGFHPDDYIEEIKEAMYFFKTYSDDDGDVFPSAEHYSTYFKVKDNVKDREPSGLEKEFIKVAEKRINYLKNNPQFNIEFEEGRQLYEEEKGINESNPSNEFVSDEFVDLLHKSLEMNNDQKKTIEINIEEIF